MNVVIGWIVLVASGHVNHVTPYATFDTMAACHKELGGIVRELGKPPGDAEPRVVCADLKVDVAADAPEHKPPSTSL